MSDAEIVTHVLAGSTDRFAELMERYLPMVRGLCASHVRTPAAQEDLVQDVFVYAFEKLDRLRDYGRFGPWLARITRSKCNDWLRSERRRQDARERLRERPAETSPADARTILMQREMCEWVRSQIGHLPDKTREAMFLRYGEGFSIADTARFLDIRESAVKKRLEYGRRLIGDRVIAEFGERTKEAQTAQASEELKERVMMALPLGTAPWAMGSSVGISAAGATARITGLLMTKKALIGAALVVAAAVGTLRAIDRAHPQPTGGGEALTTALAEDRSTTPSQNPEAASKFEERDVEEDAPAEQTAKEAARWPAHALAHLPRGAITGEVVDEKGHAVEGAEITIYHQDWYQPLTVPKRGFAAATSDADGRFAFYGLARGLGNSQVPEHQGAYILTAHTDDAMTLARSTNLSESNLEREVTLELEPASRLEGTVRTADGDPVRGALVYPCLHESQEQRYMRYYAYVNSTLWARTDGEGFFSINVQRGRWKFLVKAEHFATYESEFIDLDEPVEFILQRGGAIAGQLIDADTGIPVPDTEIAFVSERIFQDRTDVRTDAEGRFHVAALSGEHSVRLNHETLILSDPKTTTVAEGEDKTDVAFSAEPGATIAGRAYDTDTDEGIAGVRVTAIEFGKESYPLKISGITDPSGEYRIEALPPGEYTVQYSGEVGYPHLDRWRKRVEVAVNERETRTNIDFPLSRGLIISGRVVDVVGNPVAEVKVCGWDKGDARPIDYTDVHGWFELSEFTTTSDAYVQIYSKHLASDKVGPLSVPDGGLHEVVITGHAAGSISGTVVDALGWPIASAGVLPRAKTGYSRATPKDKTGKDGSFELCGLYPGTYDIRLLQPGTNVYLEESFGEVEVKEGAATTGVVVMLDERKGLTLAGRVTNQAGEPVSSARVSISGPTHTMTSTDEEGRYKLTRLTDGQYRVSVHHQDYSSAATPEPVVAGQDDVDFVLEGVAAVSGRVVSAKTGDPIPEFEILYMRGVHSEYIWGTGHTFQKVAEVNGRFTLDRVAAGEVTIVTRAPGHVTTFEFIGTVTPGERIDDIELVVEPGLVVEGTVVNPQGQPVQDALVFIGPKPRKYRTDWDKIADGRTAHDGSFKLDTVPPTAESMTAYHPDYAPTSVRFTPGSPLRITLKQGAYVEGIVTVDGEPLADAHVQVNYPDREDIRGKAVITKEDGSYSVDDLPPGDADVSAILELGEGLFNRCSHHVQALVEENRVTVVDIHFLSTTSAVEGVVLYNGQPIPNMGVNIYLRMPNGESELLQVPVQSDGTYRVENVPLGRARFQLLRQRGPRSYSGWPTSIAFEVKEGEMVRQDCILEGPASEDINAAFWSAWMAQWPH